MSPKNSLNAQTEIGKFLISIGVSFLLTTPQFNHICSIIEACTQRGYRGKLQDISDLCFTAKHYSSIGKFLNSHAWCEELVLRALQRFVIATIWALSLSTGQPIYVIVDDTISEKTKPSSKAKNPTQKGDFHFSHLKKYTVYGHQMVIILLKCGRLKLPYNIVLYDKQLKSKIQIAMDEIKKLPKPPGKGYVLADSWYSSKDVIKASIGNGFGYIGSLKVNRVIYPKKYRMNQQIQEYAKTLTKEDVHLVTVGRSEYYVYRYQGKLNGLPNPVAVILTWPKESLFKESALKAFVSTDVELEDTEILMHYTHRWQVEVFIRQCKMKFGLDKYQIRNEDAIKRFWILMMFSYVYIAFYAKSKNIPCHKSNVQTQVLYWVYEQAKSGIPFDVVAQKLKVS